MSEFPMDDAVAMRIEIDNLRVLASLATDPAVRAAVEELIEELERRVRKGSNGFDYAVADPASSHVTF
jgi:ribosome-associated translation inhibitor RaiA